jgi:hypothetical protein
MEALSGGHITQNSCLHGNANLETILTWGNGMYKIWSAGAARVYNDDYTVWDFGACTVHQLLFGYDDTLETKVELYMMGNYSDMFGNNNDDFSTYIDGSNPCVQDENYYAWLKRQYADKGTPHFNYIVINDNTRSPARNDTRAQSLDILSHTYVKWFKTTGAVPILMSTYGYWTPYRDMGGLDDVPTFTSLTYEGYRQYADLLTQKLPSHLAPRIAPVGHAFLLVWEENYELWEKLFHVDKIHASPLGTFLQGCVVYYTIFGVMPPIEIALRSDMSALWDNARRFQPSDHRRMPFPTQEEATYLYNVALRIVQYKVIPRTFIEYQNGEASTYIPMDDVYRVDDLFR